ncbi:DUF3995 domain-containing protein [Corynebacterium sp. A21]|uniref:DUF3995 domain-containing protein n=1 Tax=Corynebacterium sp. A21 TaxID=3457318 RepID=UPI003FD417FB
MPHPALLLAALAGCLHGAASVYWGLGGQWLLNTVGEQVTGRFVGMGWLLLILGALKISFALLPLRLIDAPPWRWCYWLGAAVLIIWGGMNTVVANLILVEVIPRGAQFDFAAMAGHAWLWDPLFLLWGTALVVGLLATQRSSPEPTP